MAENQGDVFVRLALDSSKYVKQFNSTVNNSVGTMNKAISSVENKINTLGKTIISAISIKGIVDISKSCIELSSNLTEVQNVTDTVFKSLSGQVDNFAATTTEGFGLSEKMAKQYAGTFGAMSSSMGYTTKQSLEMSENLTRLSGDLASFYNISQDESANKLKSIFSGETEPLRALGINLTEATLQQYALSKGISTTVSNMSQQEKATLRYNYVLENTRNAQGDFSKTSKTWANQTRVLSLQIDQLKASIGNAFITVLTPAIQNVNNFLKIINKAIAQIPLFKKTLETGNTPTQVFSDGADAVDGMTDSLEDNENVIQKIKRSLAGFDEINKLGNSSSSNKSLLKGATASDLSFVSAYTKETKKAEESTTELEKAIKKAWNTGNGYQLGEMLNNTLIKKLEGIPWDAIKKKTKKEIAGITTFLNGLISPRLFYDLGKSGAETINTFLTAMKTTAETFDFKNFGKSVASLINGGLENIDWNVALTTASEWGEQLGNTITSFAENIKPEEVGEAIANYLNMGVNFAFELIENTGWDTIGEDLSGVINSFFENFNFSKLGRAINDFIDGLKTLIKETIVNTNWDKVQDAIKDVFSEISIENLALIIGALTIKSFGKVILGSAALVAIKKAFSNQNLPVDLPGDTPKSAPKGAPSSTPTKTGLGAEDLINFTAVGTIIVSIAAIGYAIKQFPDDMKDLKEDIAWIADYNHQKISELKKDCEETINGIKEKFNNKFDELKEKGSESIENLKDTLNEKIDNIKETGSDAIDALQEKMKGLKSTIQEIKEGAAQKIESAKQTANEKLSGLSSKFSKVKKYSSSLFSFPKLADGGFVRANTPQLAVIGDNKSSGEIVAPEDKLYKIFSKVLDDRSGNNSGNSENITVPIYIGNEKIDERIIRVQRKLAVRNGGV